jgi:CBS domain-containing protein
MPGRAREREDRVRDLMSAPVHTCTTATTLAAASRRMQDARCAALVVLDDRGRLAGLLTEHELATAVAKADLQPDRLTVSAVMRVDVPTCQLDDALPDVLARMALMRARRLPVVTADGDVHGMLSIDDIVLWGTSSGAVDCQEVLRALRAIAVAALPLT